ncbi:GDP-fucose protein O-fucosyltransferase 2 [Trichinella spiralis]|uniref:GDP-fucose protein O-fucosyltransferase 2 n=1 Tax=Trichinella spiralis TaxID=6334 RepID=UPI0001EFBC59|nr:GDP-fucose protein O-fucosyltransferase 2 [Trichinella spiralis]
MKNKKSNQQNIIQNHHLECVRYNKASRHCSSVYLTLLYSRAYVMIRRCFSAQVQFTRLKQPAAGSLVSVVLTNRFNKKASKSYVEFYELLLLLIVEQGVVETLIN